jgi:hypothetical protein
MSKRLQIVMPDDEFQALADAAQRQGMPVSKLVRDSVRRTLTERADDQPEKRIAAVLRFARFNGPVADIDQILDEIERGRGL